MKAGCLFAFVAVIVCGVVTSLVLPSLLHGTNVDPAEAARKIGSLTVLIVPLPAFLIGFAFSKYRAKKEAADTSKMKVPGTLFGNSDTDTRDR